LNKQSKTYTGGEA